MSNIDNSVSTLSDFIPATSTNEIYYDTDMSVCLTDMLDGKAEVDHTHSEYAEANHTHSEYALQSDLELLEDVVDTKANSSHVHSEYASSSHSHTNYATQIALDTLSEEVDGKADVAHSHTEYALNSHSHDEYASISHSHSEYASSTHSHDNYASSSHVHSEYSVVGHDHDENYALIDHAHTDYATTTSLDELSAIVSGKANASHSHDDLYYTETEVDTKLADKADTSHTHTGVYDVSGAAADALSSANAYTDSKIDALVGEGASTTLDTIGEISSAIEDNQDAIDLLNAAIANKANAADLTAHVSNTIIHVTETDKNNWNVAKTHADTAHAPVNAEANQNAFSNVVIGNATISADTETDTLTFVAGSNITLTPNVEGDSITISATNTVYAHPTSAGNKHIPAGGSSGQILRWSADGTAVWGADNNTTYSNATQTSSGLMSNTDKTKLDGIAENANNYTLPSAGSSLGGVKTGGDVTIASGVITVNDDSHNHIISNIDGLQSALDAKAASSHSHDNVYYTEVEVDTLLSSKSDSTHNHNSSYDALGVAEEKANAVQANLDTVSNELTEHIDNTDIHFTAAERTKLSGIAAGANNYSHPNSGVTAGTYKSVTVNAQGHVTGGTNPNTLAGYGITDAEPKGAANSALASAKEYTDDAIADEVVARDSAIATAKSSAVSTAASDATTKANNALASAKTYADSVGAAVKNDLLNNAGTAYDTLKELGDLIDDNTDAIEALEAVAAGKANSVHTHAIADVSGLQSALDGKAASSHGTHVTYSTTAPVMDGTAAVGTASTVARSDHKHPIDTSRASKIEFDAHTSNKSNPHNVTLAQLGVTATAAEINKMDGVTATTAELNIMDGVTATTAEINYLDGVTSSIQTQLNGKAASSHGTHVTYSTTVPKANGTAAVGTAATVSRSDHVHPLQTTVSGNAGTATKLATARTISLAGDVSGSVSFDGSANASITATVADDSHNHVISNIDGLQTALDAKASSSHTHNYAGSSSAGGAATSANKLATARTISLTGDVSGSTSFDGSGNVSITATVADDSHNHTIANIDGLQSALDVKSDNDHRHYAINIAVEGQDLNDYTDAGFYTFAQAYAPVNAPSGNTNGWLLVIPWKQGNATVKQMWFRHGSSGTNDFETYVRTKIGSNDWSDWSKYYTTSNPPTYAEVGASPAFTNTNGGVKYSYNTSSGKNLLEEIDAMPQGVHTIYSQGGLSGNPKTTESWRLFVHKTSATIGWIVAFGSSGSIYANYQNAASSFTGWKCVYEATNKMILWTGASYLTSTNSVPQVVTPSKKLSECRTGWLLLWSDYDASSSTANDNDFCTTFIPKYTPSGGTWGGKAFLCSLPTYVGGDATDLSTQITVIKPIYVHDDCLKGSYQNTSGGRNDVVLRAVYEV